MGRTFQAIVCVDVKAVDAAAVGQRLMDWLVQQEVLRPELNGDDFHPAGAQARITTSNPRPEPLEDSCGKVFATRKVYWSEYGHSLTCPECLTSFEAEDVELERDATAQWVRGGPDDEVVCPNCDVPRPINEWESDWGYGELGVEFWDFPTLSPRFVDDVSRLTGSRVTLAAGARWDMYY